MVSAMVARNRSRFEIVYDILSAARPSARKTHLMYRGNLSYQQLELYLNFMLEKQLLEVKRGFGAAKTYSLTEKGGKFISLYQNINDFLHEPSASSETTTSGVQTPSVKDANPSQ